MQKSLSDSKKLHSDNGKNKKKRRGAKRTGQKTAQPAQAQKAVQRNRRTLGGPQNLYSMKADTFPLATNVQEQIVIEQVVDSSLLWGLIAAYVTKAVQKGFLVSTDNPSSLFWAASYMEQILISYINNGRPETMALPAWLQCLGQSLVSKEVGFQGKGQVSYKLKLTPGGTVFQPEFELGPIPYNNGWNVFIPGGSEIDFFPVGVPPMALPADGGQASWTLLTQFVSDKANIGTAIVPLGQTSYGRCVSSFAVVAVPQGGGFKGSGGTFYNAQLEVPITHPMLSVWVRPQMNNTESVAPIRAPVRAVSAAGDPVFLGYMASSLSPKAWSYKRYPRLHCVDFLEFGDVLAQWVGGVQTAYCSNPDLVTATQIVGVTPFSNAVCPISLQEMLILLRNEILSVMPLQIGVQSLYPITPSNSGDNQFTPYVMSATTCPQDQYGMMLPLPLVENIRLLKDRAVKGEGKNDVLMFLPIWGQYNNDSLDQSQYQFTCIVEGNNTSFPSFGAGGSVPLGKRLDKRKNKKGEVEETWIDMLETPINLIDGTASGSYVFINSQPRLKQLTLLWNQWIQTQQLSAYSDRLVAIGNDSGPSILPFVGSTRYWRENQAEERSSMFRDPRLEKPCLVNTVYSARNVYATTYREFPLKAAQTYFSQMILPIQYVNLNPSESIATVQRIQIEAGESYFLSESSTGDQGATLAILHANYANKMVHGQNSQATDWVEFFTTCERTGKGGALSGLMAQMAGDAFGPAVGSIATTLAGFLPF